MERTKKVAEAVKRMKMLGLYEQVIDDFEKTGRVYYSERTSLGGILYWLDNNPDWEERVKRFEEEHNAVVYHAVHNYTEFGELLALLYISDEEEEWEYEQMDIQDGYVFSYCINFNAPECSEFGSIVVRQMAGGLVRVG